MRIIISPAKKMRVDNDILVHKSVPQFIDRTETIKETMQNMSDIDLKKLWQCNDKIAAENICRLRYMDLRENLTPAILAYDGIQYKYMAPNVFEFGHFDYVEEKLRILSGFYGLLKAFDGVTPYRLEMQAKLKVGEHKNLYDFWGDTLADQLSTETDLVLNLASKEYSRAVEKYLPKSVRFVTCIFGEQLGEKITEKGVYCKMARGQAVRWLAENNISKAEDIKEFSEFGYKYSVNKSDENNFVFVRKEK